MDPEDFFYKSINWQERFNELTTLELTLMAIIALLNCPNDSCRTNVLYERGLKHFKIRTSRGPKEEFKKSFNKILKKLISKKVFKEYNKTKIPRVKINELEQRDNFLKLLKRYHKSYLNKSQSEISFIEDTSSVKQNNFMTNTTDSESLPRNNEDLENLTQDSNSDEESDAFLDDLLDDGIPELESEQYTQRISTQNINMPEIKKRIKSHYEKIDVINIKEVYPDFKLIVSGDVDIEIFVEFKPKNNLQLKCFIDFFPDAAIEILKLFGKNNFNATLCVEDFYPKEYYVIKQNIDVSIYETDEVISIIDNLIKTARYTSQLIAKFL
jgi:hypothetical protein